MNRKQKSEYESPTIDWSPSPIHIRHDLDARVRLYEAVNRSFRTIDEVIDVLITTHLELPNPRSKFNAIELKDKANELKNKLREYVSDYDYKRFRYQTLIHYCEDNGVNYSLPILPSDDIEIFHEKTGTLRFPKDKSQLKIIEIMSRLLSS